MKPFYLSLDIDYWNGASAEVVTSFLEKVTTIARQKGIPIRAFMNHHHMLSAVSKCPVKVLVNVDEHSDLSDTDCYELNCGTWIGYVKWRRKGTYIWYHPLKAYAGDCTGGWAPPIFTENGKVRTKLIDWKSVKPIRGICEPFVPCKFMKNCVELGVCVSPNFSDEYLHKVFYDWRKKYQIPYKWGRKDEDQCVRMRPE